MPADTLADHIAAQLRHNILRGTLPPGTLIKERDTAAEMHVSRTPMREAIRILAKEGLVLLRPARSPIVARLDAKAVADQAQVLIALEILSAQLACQHATPEDIAHLTQLCHDMARDFAGSSAQQIFERDMAFHSALAQASQNRALAETHQRYLQRLWYPRFLAAEIRRSAQRVLGEHDDILRAIGQCDADAARRAVETHLRQLASDIHAQIAAQQPGETDISEKTTGDTV